MQFPRSRQLAAPLLAACLLALAACGGAGGADGKVRLTVGVFGDFGFQDLYKKFEKSHPNVTIVQRTVEYADHHKNLAARLATGAGANDVEAIEEGFIASFKAQPQRFVNLLDHGAGDLSDKWLDWKWQQSLSADGKAQIGLGTDVGGLALCYRRDLFKAAGLPTDRDKVSALWSNWEDYLAAGERFVAKAPKGVAWYDSSENLANAILGQAETGVYDKQDNLVVDSNPAVKNAWDLAVRGIDAKLSAKLAGFSPEWNTGFQKGGFATISCPAWMMGYIQDQAKDSSGKWDIATVPGGSGNWGGSFLTIPKQSKHPKEAYELIKYLSAPEQQAYVFKQTGNLPSTPELYDDAEISGFSNPFFSDAPVGKIFTEAAVNLKPQYQGPKAGDVRGAIGDGLERVEQGKQSPEAAWQQVLKDAVRLAG
ncbi:MAG: ABC transporter substrate-binding protein [Micromonosporaceae bacterium]